MLLSVFLALALALSGQTPPAALPQTQPGLGRDEGVFLSTTADDGSPAIYFVARGARHSILQSDLQTELRTNPLWPVRGVERDELLGYPEATPIGSARAGLLETFVAAEAEAEDVAESTMYVLQRGDNLTHISRDHGTTVEAILDANGISNPNWVYAGMPLIIPSAAPIETFVAVEPEAAESMTYTVQLGESAIAIARRFNVDVDELLAANQVADRNRIYAGQTLTIPGL